MPRPVLFPTRLYAYITHDLGQMPIVAVIALWLIDSGEGEKKVPAASYPNSLSYHGSAVNALRFSPSGEQLASGADGGEMILWKLQFGDAGQAWKVFKTLSLISILYRPYTWVWTVISNLAELDASVR